MNAPRFPSSPQPVSGAKLLQNLLSEKSGYQIRLEGVIRRLLDTDIPEEKLVADEVKEAVRAIFPHLKFTDAELNKLIADARGEVKKPKASRGWLAVSASKHSIEEMKILSRAAGITFRLFCEMALLEARMQFIRQLGLGNRNIYKLTEAQIDSLAVRSRLLHLVGIRSASVPEKN